MKTQHIEKFIEDAIAGGWTIDGKMGDHMLEENGSFHFDIKAGDDGDPTGYTSHLGFILLDPEAWEAVGKTRGWEEMMYWSAAKSISGWAVMMHRFIDHLADGQSINTALSNLS